MLYYVLQCSFCVSQYRNLSLISKSNDTINCMLFCKMCCKVLYASHNMFIYDILIYIRIQNISTDNMSTRCITDTI